SRAAVRWTFAASSAANLQNARLCGVALGLCRARRGQLPRRRAVRRRMWDFVSTRSPSPSSENHATPEVLLPRWSDPSATLRPASLLARPTHPPPCSPPVVNRRGSSRHHRAHAAPAAPPGWSKEMPAPDYAVRDSRHAGIRRVLAVTFAANLAVVTAKAIAGIQSGALSVLADAAHSSVDAFNNLMGLLLARVAAQAPDEQHPYGHAKFETLGALAIVAFLSITVYELVATAIGRLVAGTAQPDAPPPVMAVMAVSAVVSAVVSRYEERRGQELRSELLVADAAHTRS